MSSLLDMTLRLLLAIALGAIIGYQRERAGKAAGLRTHTLISLGAALFTMVSIFGFSGAVGIAAGVVAGVGFIGAGVIFRGMGGTGVAGLTTAASIWTAAGVGLAAGAGMWLIAIIGGLAAVGILMIPKVHG
jgi:putative Mg2+ transporter-C (MgtC) family protein